MSIKLFSRPPVYCMYSDGLIIGYFFAVGQHNYIKNKIFCILPNPVFVEARFGYGYELSFIHTQDKLYYSNENGLVHLNREEERYSKIQKVCFPIGLTIKNFVPSIFEKIQQKLTSNYPIRKLNSESIESKLALSMQSTAGDA